MPSDGKMPARDLNVQAIWKESKNTPYRVEYYLETLTGGEYRLIS
jgi:hypothetical protein